MTNIRAIMILLSGILLVAVGLYLHDRHVGGPDTFTGTAAIIPFAGEDVDFIEVGFGGGKAVALRRDGVRWRIESPFKSDTDSAAVMALLDAFTISQPGDSLAASDMARLGRTFSDFGLGQAARRVTFGVGERRATVYLGANTPSGCDAYARKEGDGGVFTVSSNVVASLPADASSLRGRSLFARVGDKPILGLELRMADEPGMKLSCSDGRWHIIAPVSAPADSAAVSVLVEKLLSAKLIGFEPSEDLSESRLAARGLAAGAGFAVTLRLGPDESEQVVFGEAASNGVYVLARDRPVVARADAALAESCRAGGRSLRDTRVFAFPESELSGASFAGSPYMYALDRGTNGQWRLVSPVAAPADAKTATAFVARALEIDQNDLTPDGVRVSLSTVGTNAVSVTVPVTFFTGKGLSFADLRDKTVLNIDPSVVARISIVNRAGVSRECDVSVAADLVKVVAPLVARRVETPSAMPDDFTRCGLSKPAWRIVIDFGKEGDLLRKNLLVGNAATDGGLYVSPGGVDAAIFVVSPEIVASAEALLKSSEAK